MSDPRALLGSERHSERLERRAGNAFQSVGRRQHHEWWSPASANATAAGCHSIRARRRGTHASATLTGRRRPVHDVAVMRTLDSVATSNETRDERIHLRLSPADDGLIRAAADAARLSLTEFVIQAARTSATRTLAERDHVVIDGDAWDLLDAKVSAKGRMNVKAAELFAEPSSPAE